MDIQCVTTKVINVLRNNFLPYKIIITFLKNDQITSSTFGISKPNNIYRREHFESLIKKINPPSKYIGDFSLIYVIV